ncbi:hypothetical protein AOLI_G00231320 [Acnodon oligacanthus]
MTPQPPAISIIKADTLPPPLAKLRLSAAKRKMIPSHAGSTHPSSSPSSPASSFRYVYRLKEDPEASWKRPLADLPSFPPSHGKACQRRGGAEGDGLGPQMKGCGPRPHCLHSRLTTPENRQSERSIMNQTPTRNLYSFPLYGVKNSQAEICPTKAPVSVQRSSGMISRGKCSLLSFAPRLC